MIYKTYFKRPLDFILALCGLLILSPIILITIVILTISFRESPFFIQKRPGKNEKIFSVLKLKTMNSRKDANGNLLPDSERLTPMGIFIRKTSIDELPQLINVLTGDMSLIGPRPLLIRYLPYYTTEEKKRFLIRPGITGLAQISGRNFMSWEDKFIKDIEYMEQMSFKNDLIIIFKTIEKIFNPGEIDVDPNSNPSMLAMDLQRQDWDQFKHLKKS
ncbi:sugar transferase [Maribacter dokdonensis]|uniref:sugar transferase n=1 Tax=Maribacter dokdonensis TaxID=320912 RepID=UPI002AB2B934|nr:sugar transferase [Maribacter dokdonensis]